MALNFARPTSGFSGPGKLAFGGTQQNPYSTEMLPDKQKTGIFGPIQNWAVGQAQKAAQAVNVPKQRVAFGPNTRELAQPGTTPTGAPATGVVDSNGKVGIANAGGGAATPFQYAPAAYDPNYAAPSASNADLNLEKPGPGQQAWEQYGSRFFQPTQSGQAFAAQGQNFLAPDANQQLWERTQAQGPQVNNAQTEYNASAGRRPDIAADPGFASYYDNAQKKYTTAMNAQLAASGQYGSGVGLGILGQGITDLRADQAKNEAQYNLDRLSEQRQWDTLGGTLARNADLSGTSNLDAMRSLADDASRSREAGLVNYMNAAGSADNANLSGLTGGMTAALGTEGARTSRINTVGQQIAGATNSLQGVLGEDYDKLLSGDMSLQDAILSAYTVRASNDANYANSQSAKMMNDLYSLASGGASLYTALNGTKKTTDTKAKAG